MLNFHKIPLHFAKFPIKYGCILLNEDRRAHAAMGSRAWVTRRPEAVRRLENVARALCSEMRDPAEAPAARDEETGAKGQSCHLPVTADGAPIMGKVPGTENVYVATGHSCWGILNAPASGAAMAELVADGSVTVVRGFERFAPRRDGDA